MTEKRKILRQVGSFASASLLTQGITVIASILTRRFLGPLQMGVWSFIQVILIYAEYSTLGINNAVSREIPFHLGAKNHERAEEIKNLVFNFSVSTSLVIAAGMTLFACLYRKHLRPELLYGLFFAAALIIFQRVNNLLIELLRSYKKFALLSRQMIFSAIVNAGLIALLAYRFKIYGFITAMCLSLAFNIGYFLHHEKFHFRWRLDIGQVGQLIGYGFPLMMIAFLNSALQSFDRLMITRFLGFEALGWYSIAIMSSTYIYSIPNSIGIVMLPNVQERYGEAQNIQGLKSYLLKWTFAYRDMMPILIGLAWVWVPGLVAWVLPQYQNGLDAMKLLVLSSFFFAMHNPYEHFLIAIKKHWRIFPVIFSAFAAAVLLIGLAVKNRLGIAGIAAAMTGTAFIQFSGIYFTAGCLVYSKHELWRNYLSVLINFVLMLLALYGLQICVFSSNKIFQMAAQSAVLFVLWIPLLLRLNKNYGLWAALVKKKTVPES